MKRENSNSDHKKQINQLLIIKGEATKVNRLSEQSWAEALHGSRAGLQRHAVSEVSANSGEIPVQRWRIGVEGWGVGGGRGGEKKPVVTKAVYPCNFLRFKINSSRG